MGRRVVEPPRGLSESHLRRTMVTQLVMQGTVGVLVFSSLLLNEDTGLPRVVSVGLLVVWLVAAGFFVGRFRALGSWRSLPVGDDEQLLWGTAASRIRPTGGAGWAGQFSASTRRLSYWPGLVARLRGATAEEWPIESVGSVRVTPGNGRALTSGRWVVVETGGDEPVILHTSEPRAVADDLEEALRQARR